MSISSASMLLTVTLTVGLIYLGLIPLNAKVDNLITRFAQPEQSTGGKQR
ncbi:hypothetical protein IQ250_06015 [Pseudanabaenaceae cyanobacterium LEGE 13415]|nr:hypothetical protein [Pseudanabaenaceae cyanobacterium LEGE 13415]